LNNHVFRPLFVALAIVAAILLVRLAIVPADFGIYERGYMYGWHSKANELEWEKVHVKYRTSTVCAPCHRKNFDSIRGSAHEAISCENCHGPVYDHPRDPAGLTIDRSRSLCIRCHARLPYKGSDRGKIRGINPDRHYPSEECVLCHIPHNPKPVMQKREVKS